MQFAQVQLKLLNDTLGDVHHHVGDGGIKEPVERAVHVFVIERSQLIFPQAEPLGEVSGSTPTVREWSVTPATNGFVLPNRFR